MSWHVSALCEARRQFGHRWYPPPEDLLLGLGEEVQNDR